MDRIPKETKSGGMSIVSQNPILKLNTRYHLKPKHMQWIADDQLASEHMLASTQKSLISGKSPKNWLQLQPQRTIPIIKFSYMPMGIR